MNSQIMKAVGFGQEVEDVSNGRCPFCKKDVAESDFCDAISLKEFQISGLCQKCQDKTFGRDSHKTLPLEEKENEWTDEPYKMICGSTDAEKRRYKKLIGKSGRTWLVSIQDDAAGNVYVSANPKENTPGYKGFQGFGGRTLHFVLEDETKLDLTGPWHSNASALFEDTNYDVRDKHLTFGVVGLGREWKTERGCCGPVTITNVIYKDSDWIIGEYNRINKIAQELANKLNKTVIKFVKSHGGSSCGPVEPEELEQEKEQHELSSNPAD